MAKRPDFFEAFAKLPRAHKATVVVALRMYAQVMKSNFGGVTFTQEDIEQQTIFDDIGVHEKLEPFKALDFAARLNREIL